MKVHEAFSLDSFQDRLLFFDDFHGDQIQDEWRTAGTGSAAVVDAQTGGIVRLTTGAVTNNSRYIDWQNYRSLHVDKKVTIETRVKLETTTAIGFFVALLFDFSNYIMIQADTTLLATNWRIYSEDGGVTTSADSGIVFSTDYTILRIECFPTGEVHYYVDGVECGNSPITTNIPDDAADFLQPYLNVTTRENATKYVDIDYVYLRQER